jgi:CRISPR-associated protein Cas2
MYIIITYDIADEKRLNKIRKILKKYLYWVQYSIFEGEISEGKLKKCQSELNKIININDDSVFFYKIKIPENLKKKVLGIEKNYMDNIL